LLAVLSKVQITIIRSYYNRVRNKSYGSERLPLPGLSELPRTFLQHFFKHEHATLKGIQTPMVMQELEDLHIGRQVILTYSTKGRQLGEEQGPNGLGPILMNLPTDIFSPAMVDALIMVAQVVQEVVTFGRIGVNGASWGNGPGHNRL